MRVRAQCECGNLLSRAQCLDVSHVHRVRSIDVECFADATVQCTAVVSFNTFAKRLMTHYSTALFERVRYKVQDKRYLLRNVTNAQTTNMHVSGKWNAAEHRALNK